MGEGKGRRKERGTGPPKDATDAELWSSLLYEPAAYSHKYDVGPSVDSVLEAGRFPHRISLLLHAHAQFYILLEDYL